MPGAVRARPRAGRASGRGRDRAVVPRRGLRHAARTTTRRASADWARARAARGRRERGASPGACTRWSWPRATARRRRRPTRGCWWTSTSRSWAPSRRASTSTSARSATNTASCPRRVFREKRGEILRGFLARPALFSTPACARSLRSGGAREPGPRDRRPGLTRSGRLEVAGSARRACRPRARTGGARGRCSCGRTTSACRASAASAGGQQLREARAARSRAACRAARP